MEPLVIDGSTALGFLLPDEQHPEALKAKAIMVGGAPIYVPAHWCIEVANGLLMAERRKRIAQAEVTRYVNLVQTMQVTVDDETFPRLATHTVALARQFGLTIYDAAYLELALRRRATLATTDRDLAKAAKTAGVAVLQG
jgi:predicted nucleic acid-binding protein